MVDVTVTPKYRYAQVLTGAKLTTPRLLPRNATCAGKGGSESLRRDICASTKQPLEQIDDLFG